MSEEDRELFKLRDLASNIFVKNDADITQPRVIAAVTDAARNMSLVSGIASKEDTHDAILDAFGAKDIDYISSMVETMSPTSVKSIIGYSVNYMDFGSAYVNYNAQKALYDALYNEVNLINKHNEKSL